MRKFAKKRKINIEIVAQVAISILLFFIIYTKNEYMPGCWEMPDEGGYLFNAALFTKTDWTEAFSNLTSYYGYGYSLFFIPLFVFCHSGAALLNGVIVINILFVIATYNVWVSFFKALFPEIDRTLLLGGVAVICLFPALFSFSLKIFPETLIALSYSLVALDLLYVVKKKTILHGVLLGLLSSFIFFVHTRTIIVIGVLGITMIGLLFLKKIPLKTFIAYLGVLLSLFGVMYWIKMGILDILGTGRLVDAGTSEINNVVSGNLIVERIFWIFSDNNWIKYLLVFGSKFFYAATATAGTFLFGMRYCIIKLRQGIEKKEFDIQTVGCIFFLANLLFMVLAFTFMGVGSEFAYIFYGRYYEFLLLPLIFLGVMALCEESYDRKEFLKIICIYLILGACAVLLQLIHVKNGDIRIDTNRLTGIAFEITRGENNLEVLFFCIAITISCVLVFLLAQRAKGMLRIIIVLLTVWGVFALSNKENLQIINNTDGISQTDIEIADFILDNMEEDKQIWFVYEDYRYNVFYQRMQIFIKEYPMHVIFPEELDMVREGDFIITYKNTEASEKLQTNGEAQNLYESHHYELFVK